MGKGLEELGLAVEYPIETNLVYFSATPEATGVHAAELVSRADDQGIRLLTIGGERMRIVTHHQVSAEGVERALDVFKAILAEGPKGEGKAGASYGASLK